MDDIKDTAITLLQTLVNATGAEFEDEKLAVDIITKTITEVVKNNAVLPLVMSGFYTDGIDHSNLEVNSDQFPEHEECVNCGNASVTITDDKDICHDCGYVYE